jgi:hypothetical protein
MVTVRESSVSTAPFEAFRSLTQTDALAVAEAVARSATLVEAAVTESTVVPVTKVAVLNGLAAVVELAAGTATTIETSCVTTLVDSAVAPPVMYGVIVRV